MKEMARILYRDSVYYLPIYPVYNITQDGKQFTNGGIGGWWTYHFSPNEYFDIVYNGCILDRI